jgi:hypothetical protein
MMEAVRTSETSVDNHFTRQYIPEDNSEQYLCPSSVQELEKGLALFVIKSRGSSVSIVSDYGLGDRGSIPGRGDKIFPLTSVSMGTGGPFPGGKSAAGA